MASEKHEPGQQPSHVAESERHGLLVSGLARLRLLRILRGVVAHDQPQHQDGEAEGKQVNQPGVPVEGEGKVEGVITDPVGVFDQDLDVAGQEVLTEVDDFLSGPGLGKGTGGEISVLVIKEYISILLPVCSSVSSFRFFSASVSTFYC